MPTVVELSDPYANFLLTPGAPEAGGVCSVCLTLIEGDYPRCYPCQHHARGADGVLPISYSIHRGQLHAALRGYKSDWASAARFKLELAAVLWRFLEQHEGCLARRVGVEGFGVVTTVPSSDIARDAVHPLHDVVGRVIGRTADRHERLLRRSGAEVEARAVDVHRFDATRVLAGESVLLIDDTWTTGASVESAALALKAAGAATVGVVVIGRHINDDYADNASRLEALPRFSWERCAIE